MNYDLGPISLVVPGALVDTTAHRFESASRDRLLTAAFPAVRPGDGPDSLTRPVLARLAGAYPGRVTVRADEAGSFLGAPARRLVLGWLTPDAQAVLVQIAACVGETGAVKLRLQTEASPAALGDPRALDAGAAEAARVMDHVLATAAWVTPDAPVVPAARGFVRRQVGRVWLEIPRALKPRGEYRFALPDDSLALFFSFLSDPLAPFCPRFDAEVPPLPADSRLVVRDAAEHPRDVAGCAGWYGRWDVEARAPDGTPVAAFAFRRLRVRLDEHLAFDAFATATDAGALAGVWETLEQSIRCKEDSNG